MSCIIMFVAYAMRAQMYSSFHSGGLGIMCHVELHISACMLCGAEIQISCVYIYIHIYI